MSDVVAGFVSSVRVAGVLSAERHWSDGRIGMLCLRRNSKETANSAHPDKDGAAEICGDGSRMRHAGLILPDFCIQKNLQSRLGQAAIMPFGARLSYLA